MLNVLLDPDEQISKYRPRSPTKIPIHGNSRPQNNPPSHAPQRIGTIDGKSIFGPVRPPGAPLTGPITQTDPNVTTFMIGDLSGGPVIDTKGMSCADFQRAAEIPNDEIEARILSAIKAAGSQDEAAWRAANSILECPTEQGILSNVLPYIPGTAHYFFYPNFQAEELRLAFKVRHFPEYTHFSEVWQDKEWYRRHYEAPYQHLFAVEARWRRRQMPLSNLEGTI